MTKVEVGKKAPPFTLDGTGGEFALADAVGSVVVMYFYPRDNTPGCTQEGESFTAHFAQFKKAKTMILGVSADTIESHGKFKKKMGFPFDLLSDPDQKVCKLTTLSKRKTCTAKSTWGSNAARFWWTPRACSGRNGVR